MVKIEIHDDNKVFYNGEYYGLLDCAIVQQEFQDTQPTSETEWKRREPTGIVTISLSIDCREIEKCP